MSEAELKASVCSTCGNTFGWHEESNPRHPFAALGTQSVLADTRRDERPAQTDSGPIVRTSTPFDPVLRLALIDAGVITPDDLDKADKKIRQLTQGLGRPDHDSE